MLLEACASRDEWVNALGVAGIVRLRALADRLGVPLEVEPESLQRLGDSASHAEARHGEMASRDLRRFAGAHHAHGDVEGDADDIETDAGYCVWAA